MGHPADRVGIVFRHELTEGRLGLRNLIRPLHQHFAFLRLARVGLGLVEEVQGQVEVRLEAGVLQFLFLLVVGLGQLGVQYLGGLLDLGAGVFQHRPGPGGFRRHLLCEIRVHQGAAQLRPALHDRDLGHVEFHFAAARAAGVGGQPLLHFVAGLGVEAEAFAAVRLVARRRQLGLGQFQRQLLGQLR